MTDDGLEIDLYDGDGNLRPLSEIEADVINLAVCLYGGRIGEISRRLRIGRSTLYRKIERNGDRARRAKTEPRSLSC